MVALDTDALLAGRYRLRGVLGRGGMAEVYEAFDERLHRAVAVKLLRPEVAARPDVRRRFEVEARFAARLSHPNVVAIYDTGDDDDTAYLVMEKLPGETLADHMPGEGSGPRADEQWFLRVAGEVLLALGAAHAAGLVHRDVKPGNILIAADGHAKVADFGIAKSLEFSAGADLTDTNQLVGTPAYVAPERIAGNEATAQADLYALGVVLYEAFAGQKPFSGPTPVAVAYSVSHSQPEPLLSRRPDLLLSTAVAIERAMARDPQARFASAADMAAALGVGPGMAPVGTAGEPDPTMASALPDPTAVLPSVVLTPVPGPPSQGPKAASRRANDSVERRRRLTVVAVGVALAVLALVGVAAALGGDTDDPHTRAASGLERVASSLDSVDGGASTAAHDQLVQLVPVVEGGGGAPEANALLGQLAVWRDAGQLTAAAVERIRTAVLRVPGAEPSAFSVPTTAPPPPATTTPPDQSQDEERQPRERGKKKGDG